jgi:hypothetical protein
MQLLSEFCLIYLLLSYHYHLSRKKVTYGIHNINNNNNILIHGTIHGYRYNDKITIS